VGIVFRQSAKSAIVIFAGAILGAAINYIYTFIFEKTELGLITNLTNQGAIMQVAVLMGVSSLLITYIARYPVGDPRRKVLITLCMGVPAVVTLLFTAAYALFRPEIVQIYQPEDQSAIRQYYYWLPVIILGWSYTSLLDLYLTSQMKAATGAVVREIVLRVCNIALIALFFFRLIDFPTFVVLMSLAYFVPVATALVIAARTNGFGFSTNFRAFSKSEYRQLAHFSWYHLLEGISFTVMGYIDSLMLAPLSAEGVASLSVYRNALFIATVMVLPLRAIIAASFPVLNQAYIDGDHTRLKGLYTRTGLNTLITGVGMFVVIACNLDNAVAIFPEGYEQLKPVTLILLAGKLMHMASGMSGEVTGLSKFYRFNFRVSIVLLVLVILLNRLLIPQYGIAGAAWGATIAMTVFSLIKMFFVWKKLGLPPFIRHSRSVLVAGILAGVFGWLLPAFMHPVADALLRTLLIMGIYTAALLWLSPGTDFSNYVKGVLQRRKLF
jgi:O-antigen/teichoic acid export membrane protein